MSRLVVADDHAVVRAGIRAVLAPHGDLRIVAEAGDGRATVEAVIAHRPNLLLLDLTMPLLNGLDALHQARAALPSLRVLVLSMHSAPELVRPALQAGALGYVVKGSGLDELVPALRAVLAGRPHRDLALQQEDWPGTAADALDRLTAREREVLQLVAEGHSNREAGDVLGISAKTVDTHRTSLMRKLDLHSAQAVTRFALRRGLVGHE